MLKRLLADLLASSLEPIGYVAAMRALASAPEPVIKPLRSLQPLEETGIEKHDREELAELERLGKL